MGRRFGRRMFLCGAGSAMLVIPTLSSLLPGELAAQAAPAAKRFVGLFSRNGHYNTDWLPSTPPSGYAQTDALFEGNKADGTTFLHERLPEDPRYRYAPLSDFRETGISNILGASLTPHLDKLTLLRGVDFANYCGHNHGAFYGNYAACTAADTRTLEAMPTIDQVLAYSDRFYPTRPARRDLRVGTGSPRSFSYSDFGIAGGAVEQLNCLLDPKRVWDELFAGVTLPDEAPTENPNRAVLNGIYEDYARVRTHARLSGEDRQTLERHMSFLSEIEAELAGFTASCVLPEPPPSFEHGAPYRETGDIDAFRQSTALLVDLCVAAIRCDLTRVVTFDIAEALQNASGVWEGSYHSSADDPSDWHHYAHDAVASESSRAKLVAINRWIADEIFAPLVEKLDVEEADGATFLDNSLVCWGSELGPSHWNVSVPTLIAGGAGGAITTGRYIDYSQWDRDYARANEFGVVQPGIAHNRLLVSILQAMGLAPEDYERDGRAGYGHAEGTMGLASWPDDAWDLSRVGEPLPGLVA